MRNNIKYSALSIIIILSLMLGYSTYANEVEVEVKTESKLEIGTQPVACTMDAKVCSDGSSVGRVGPKCEFAKCPDEIKKFDIQRKKDELKKEFEAEKVDIKTFKEEHKAEINALINSIKENRSTFKAEMEVKKIEVKTKVEEMKLKFKEDLTKIKDEKKKISAEKIVNALVNLNTNLTTQLSNKVDQIENVLVSIESRISKAEGNGVDVTSTKAEVEKAKIAIASARSAIGAQASKVYTVNITDESTLRALMKKMRDLFYTDMKAVRATVKSAHMAVKTVATTLAKIPKIDDIKTEVENNNTINQ